MAWHLLTYSQKPGVNINYMEFLIDLESDISTPPQNFTYAPGSIAHTPGYAKMYESDANGDWVEIGGDA